MFIVESSMKADAWPRSRMLCSAWVVVRVRRDIVATYPYPSSIGWVLASQNSCTRLFSVLPFELLFPDKCAFVRTELFVRVVSVVPSQKEHHGDGSLDLPLHLAPCSVKVGASGCQAKEERHVCGNHPLHSKWLEACALNTWTNFCA